MEEGLERAKNVTEKMAKFLCLIFTKETLDNFLHRKKPYEHEQTQRFMKYLYLLVNSGIDDKTKHKDYTNMFIRFSNVPEAHQYRFQMDMNCEMWHTLLWDALMSVFTMNMVTPLYWAMITEALTHMKYPDFAIQAFDVLDGIVQDEDRSRLLEFKKKIEMCKNEHQQLGKQDIGPVFKFDFYNQEPSTSERLFYFDKLCNDLPIAIIEIEGFGRGIVATKKINSGALIFAEKSFLFGSLAMQRCYHCFKPVDRDIIHCEPCGKVGMRYCSNECLKEADSQYHRVLCGKDFKRMFLMCCEGKDSSCKAFLMLVRMVAMIVQRGHDEAFDPSLSELRSGYNLTYAWNDESTSIWPFFPMLALLKNVFKLEYAPQFDIDWIVKWVTMLVNNSHSLSYGNNDPYATKHGGSGSAYLKLSSFFNHSCEPNATIQWNPDKHGDTANIIATKTIIPGEQIFLSYIDKDGDYERRTKALRQYHFVCTCRRCSNKI